MALPDHAAERSSHLRPLLGGMGILLLGGVLSLTLGCKTLNPFVRLRGQNEPQESQETTVLSPPGTPSKHALRIPPYIFFSDFELKRDQPIFTELEEMRTQLYKELQLPMGDAMIQVYLFEDRDHYESFMQAQHPTLPRRRAFFMAQQRTVGGKDDLLVYTYWGDRIQQDLRHELTHALLHSVLKDVPLWLDEGLAEYFELPSDGNGYNEIHLTQLLRTSDGDIHPDLPRLERLKDISQMSPAEYRESWAWVNLMLHGKPEGKAVLLRYLRELRDNPAPPPLTPRLAAVYPSLEEAYLQHLARMEALHRKPGSSER